MVLVLGACSDDGEAGEDATSSSSTSTTATTTGAAPSTSGTTAAAPGAAAAIQLRADGLGGFAFGAAESEVLPALAEALGHADSDDALPPGACSGGATRSVTWGDLNVLIGPDQGGTATLYGWTYGTDDPPAAPALATAEGVGIGATRRQLEAAYGGRVEIDDSGDNVSFTLEDGSADLALTGVLTGPAATDTVRALFAGSYCGE